MKKAVLALIRFYQRYISPAKGPCCRFIPTCSTYAAQAIEKFGIFRGGFLALKRVLRCNPLCPGGYDPVPDEYPKKGRKHPPTDKRKEKRK